MTITEPSEIRSTDNYKVVARKYRPGSFEALIGQDQIALALSNAIAQNRIGHAYLFAGARGVGKTSSARIFAKCLNCTQGPTSKPCNECDICQSISQGEDVDVLEIDGASNRGIDEIRSLRSNAAIRPSRSRYKIYIIDEVHMLTTPAFNALLKTLEEPPRHVKFIFCTTDPQKMPITVLSRCQRFDFSPVKTAEIADSLRAIAAQEGIEAEKSALELLARRANGSMRDSQSLLEQLLAYSGGTITVAHVHQLLGTADMGQVATLAMAMIEKDSQNSFAQIHQSILSGTDAGQLASQLLGYFRDVLAVKVKCGLDNLLVCSASDLDSLKAIGKLVGIETLLAVVQIFDNSIVKMQTSLHARTLLEVAVIRVCNLQNLDAVADLVKQVSELGGNAPVRANLARSTGEQISAQAKVTTESDSADSKKKEKVVEIQRNDLASQVIAGPNLQNVSQREPDNSGEHSIVLTTSAGAALFAGSKASQADRDFSVFAKQEASDPAIDPGADSAIVRGTDLEINSKVPARIDPGSASRSTAFAPNPEDQSVISKVNAHPPQSVAGPISAPSSTSAPSPTSSPSSTSTPITDVQEGMALVASGPSSPLSTDSEARLASKLAGSEMSSDLGLQQIWPTFLDQIGGLTRDLLSNPVSLQWLPPNQVIISLKDDYKTQECNKPDRKKKIDQLIAELLKRPSVTRVVTSAQSAPNSQEIVPQLSRAQQMRMLHDHAFVKMAIDVFDCQIQNFSKITHHKK